MRIVGLSCTVLLWACLLLGCSGVGAAPSENLVPQSVKDDIIARYYGPAEHRNVQIEVTGEATILAHEKSQGVEQAACLKIRYEKKLAGDKWVAGASSRVIQRIGNDWVLNNALLAVERAWSQHSCPGSYEVILPQ